MWAQFRPMNLKSWTLISLPVHKTNLPNKKCSNLILQAVSFLVKKGFINRLSFQVSTWLVFASSKSRKSQGDSSSVRSSLLHTPPSQSRSLASWRGKTSGSEKTKQQTAEALVKKITLKCWRRFLTSLIPWMICTSAKMLQSILL